MDTFTTVTGVLPTITSIIVIAILYFNWKFKYWERKNMPYLNAGLESLRTIWQPEAFGSETRQYITARQRGLKHVGLYSVHVPVYMPLDPQYIKNIMTRDFDHFMDRGLYVNEKDDPISGHLFSLAGARWRNLRIKLTPTFTSGKLKTMFHTLVECGNPLMQYLDEKCLMNEPIEIKSVASCFTTDVIGSCAFGLECNSFQDPNSTFRRNLERNLTTTTYENLKGYFYFSFPELSRFLGITPTPPEVAAFFSQVIKDTVSYRERNNFKRSDFLQLLIELKEDERQSLTIEEIIAQSFVFLVAGYESSSLIMSFCLFELCMNKDIQQRARDEIIEVLEKHEMMLTYDAAAEMKYLSQVIEETLRKYPPLPILMRKCIADYKIPNTEVTLDKGTSVVIPVIGLHHDEEHFPNPDEFDPDRFSKENKNKITPFTYMPFGEGPRICIASRFGLMQIKVGLCTLLKNYEFSLNEKTKVPLRFRNDTFTLMTYDPIWLDIVKLN